MSSRYQHYRGGLGVRKRLSEESLRDTYRLNGVRSGFGVARCYDRYGRWELGYTLGVVVRKTASVVQIRWQDEPEEIRSYDAGDARYEVDRGRWRILGMLQPDPLNPDNPVSAALTTLRASIRVEASGDSDSTPPTEENDQSMSDKLSKAAQERAAAKKALTNGELKERETYTAKQVAARCGTDSKTMRKFFRTSASTVEPVGQGGRYEFDAKDFPKIKREFDAWRKRAVSRQSVKKVEATDQVVKNMAQAIQQHVDDSPADTTARDIDDDLFGEDPGDPTEEDLAAIGDIDLDDLDELDD